MFNLIKPGHVLRFATCPSTIISPMVDNPGPDDGQQWPAVATLGNVALISHPSGALGSIAADVATHLRAGGSPMRSMSYSPVGRAMTASNQPLGNMNCDFVGYTDGHTYFTPSAGTVISKDFSGCLMVAYTYAGARRVAHSAKSALPAMNCVQRFLTAIQADPQANLIGWFQPYVDTQHFANKLAIFNLVANHIGGNINNLVTFGVITNNNLAYDVTAFRPAGMNNGSWVVGGVNARVLTNSFVAPP